MTASAYLTAREAAAELGVSLPTLYAYVSRGLIRSEARPGSRSKIYAANDVRALADRSATGSAARGGNDRPLDWGAPILDSAITLITPAGLHYRGRDAVRLSSDTSVEAVAGLLWQAEGDPFADAPYALPPLSRRLLAGLSGLDPIDRIAAGLPVLASEDDRLHALGQQALCAVGARLIGYMAAIIADVPVIDRPIHQSMGHALGLAFGGVDVLRRTLILVADHELNASTFAVRVAASTGAGPAACLAAGVATLSGPRHGGQTRAAGRLLDEALTMNDPARAAVERLRGGEAVPGFGHRLYPNGDPRADALLTEIMRRTQGAPVVEAARRIITVMAEAARDHPNLDFALALFGRAYQLAPSAPQGLFALGRSIGWLAHMMEQRQEERLIRPRARYVGPHP